MANKRIVDLDPFQGSLNDEDLLIMYDDTSLNNSDRTRKITVGDFKASTSQDLSTYATKEQLNGYATTESLESYATTDSISTLGEAQGLATTSWVQTQFGNQAVYFFTTAQLPPVSEAKTNVIYLVPAATSGTDNAKDEYIYLSTGSFEKIGNTSGGSGLNNFLDGQSSSAVHQINSGAEGPYSVALGYMTTAGNSTCMASFAEGYGTFSNSGATHAEGYQTTAEGEYSHAEGYRTYALGSNSHAEGHSTSAIANRSHAEGYQTTASGETSHAQGTQTLANNGSAHAQGYQTTAFGAHSHAEGYGTYASGSRAHTEGYYTKAQGSGSHAEGYQTTALGRYSHSGGFGTWTDSASTAQTAIGRYNSTPTTAEAFIVGNGTSTADRSNAFTVDWNGNTTAAGAIILGSTGTGNKAVSYTQMANYVATHGGGGTVLNNYLEDYDNTMIGDIESLQANGTFAIALGCNSSATAEASIALGEDVLSKGQATIAEGLGTTAGSGGSAHAEGEYTLASGAASHSQNIGTIAQSIGQTAIGRYNIANGGTSISTTAVSDHAFIIGNGTSANRSNAFSVSWNGNVNASGAVYLGSTATGNAAVSCDQMTDYVGYIPFGNTYSLDGTMTVLPDLQASPTMSGDSIATPANNAYVVPFIVRNS